MRCILCRIVPHRRDELESIYLITPFSRKTVIAVLKYLGKMEKPSIDITCIDQQDICKVCLKDIFTFDEYMVKLLEVQRRLISLMRKLAETEEYNKLETPLIGNVKMKPTSKDITFVEVLKNAESEDFLMKNNSDVRKSDIPVRCNICNSILKSKSQLHEHLETLHKSLMNIELELLDPLEAVEKANKNVETFLGVKSDGIDSYELRENETKIDTSAKNIESDENTNNIDCDDLEESIGENTTNMRKYNIQVKCNLCNSILKNKSQLRQHIKASHKPLKKIWKCEVCGTTARNEEYLELHMNIHEGKSMLECRYCNKRFRRKVNVIEHMQKHWDKKNFQCERCGLRFSERLTYYNHRLQHEAEEDPLICDICTQSFKTRRTYNRHLWIHREDRPRFDCEMCGKKFLEKYRLKLHLRSHNQSEDHNEIGEKLVNAQRPRGKSIECIICGGIFQSNELLDQHMKVQHDVIL